MYGALEVRLHMQFARLALLLTPSDQHDFHEIVIVVVADGHGLDRNDGIERNEKIVVFLSRHPMGDFIESVGIHAGHYFSEQMGK